MEKIHKSLQVLIAYLRFMPVMKSIVYSIIFSLIKVDLKRSALQSITTYLHSLHSYYTILTDVCTELLCCR